MSCIPATSVQLRRRVRDSIAVTTLAVLVSSCALLRGREPAKEVAVDLSVTRTEAVRRTLAAFRDQGYEVRESLTSGTNPETEPFRQNNTADVVFRAAITGSGRTSRVVFSGTYRKRQLGGLMHGDEKPVRDSDDPLERELWARLSNLAVMLRRGAGGAGTGLRGLGTRPGRPSLPSLLSRLGSPPVLYRLVSAVPRLPTAAVYRLPSPPARCG
jgi:hypothetical protein